MIWAFYTSALRFIIQFFGRNIKTSAVRNISSKDGHNTFSSKMKMTFGNKDY